MRSSALGMSGDERIKLVSTVGTRWKLTCVRELLGRRWFRSRACAAGSCRPPPPAVTARGACRDAASGSLEVGMIGTTPTSRSTWRATSVRRHPRNRRAGPREQQVGVRATDSYGRGLPGSRPKGAASVASCRFATRPLPRAVGREQLLEVAEQVGLRPKWLRCRLPAALGGGMPLAHLERISADGTRRPRPPGSGCPRDGRCAELFMTVGARPRGAGHRDQVLRTRPALPQTPRTCCGTASARRTAASGTAGPRHDALLVVVAFRSAPPRRASQAPPGARAGRTWHQFEQRAATGGGEWHGLL